MGMRSRHGDIEIEVTVKREELLKRLNANRNKHKQEFELAIAAWQSELESVLKSTVAQEITEFPIALAQLQNDCPVSHVNEYDQAIDMFNMSINEEIKLDSDAFNTFCRDEWGWKTSLSRNRFYRNIGVVISDRG